MCLHNKNELSIGQLSLSKVRALRTDGQTDATKNINTPH